MTGETQAEQPKRRGRPPKAKPAANPVGRPTKYKPEYCAQAIKMGKKGYSRAMIANAFDVAKQTLALWEQAQPEFMDAMRRAETAAQAWFEVVAMKGVNSREFNAAAWKFQAQSRFRDDYGEQKTLTHQGPDGGDLILNVVHAPKRNA